MVDRLLASPHYGERWGRHWLDVARYADSNGLDENIAYGNAWRYRDYVVRAFNADKPYDQFLIEQTRRRPAAVRARKRITRHRLPRPRAAGAGRAGRQKMEMDIIDEQIDTLGKAFLGLTLGCARCHDHKFDPITQEDYYALAAIFRSTRSLSAEKMGAVKFWHEHSLATPAQLDELKKYDEAVKAKKAEIDALLAKRKSEPKSPLASPAGGAEGLDAATLAQADAMKKELKELEESAPGAAGGHGRDRDQRSSRPCRSIFAAVTSRSASRSSAASRKSCAERDQADPARQAERPAANSRAGWPAASTRSPRASW